jgi:hypothetical protein
VSYRHIKRTTQRILLNKNDKTIYVIESNKKNPDNMHAFGIFKNVLKNKNLLG